MILSLRQDYKLDANEAVDKYNYFVERPLKEVSERYKNPPVKRSWRKTDQMVKENEKAISRIEKDEEARKKASIY